MSMESRQFGIKQGPHLLVMNTDSSLQKSYLISSNYPHEISVFLLLSTVEWSSFKKQILASLSSL